MAADISEYYYPTPSGNCKKAIELLSGNDVNINSLVEAVHDDEDIVNAVIRYSNSPVHPRETEISDLATAANILGLKNVKIVLLSAVLKEYMQDNLTGNRILHHCLTISALSSLVAIKVSKALLYEVELLGVLHDLPSMVLCHNHKPEYRSLIKGMTSESPPLEKLELDIFKIPPQSLLQHAAKELCLPKSAGKILHDFYNPSETASTENKHIAILNLAHHMEYSVVPKDLRLPTSLRGEKAALLIQLGISDVDYSELINLSREVINDHLALVA